VPADYAIGRRAVVIPYTSCGRCPACRSGRVNACRDNRTLGVQQDGGLTERIALPFSKLILNDTLAPRHLALVEPLSVGFHAVARGRVAPGERVLVMGCGMVGLGAVAAAAARGAEVIAVDIGPVKVALAKRYGARHGIDLTQRDLGETVAQLTGGDGVDVVLEAVGSPQTFLQAIDSAAPAGRVVYVGYCKEPVSYRTQLFNLKELDIMGSRNATQADFKDVIAFLEGRSQSPDDLISKVFPFDQATEALPFWEAERDRTVKVVIERCG
jgi:threonine dehydrogenase-like Zn-dependent dehydrogenase